MFALPLSYYRWHLGVWSRPSHALRSADLPSVRAIFTLLAIGTSAPARTRRSACISAVVLGASAWRKRTNSDSYPGQRSLRQRPRVAVASVWLRAVGRSRSRRRAPGVDRWTLSLLQLALYVRHATTSRTPSTRPRRNRLVVMLAWPTLASGRIIPAIDCECTRYPTRLAAWLWTMAPASMDRAPESSTERASRREPAQLKRHWPGLRGISSSRTGPGRVVVTEHGRRRLRAAASIGLCWRCPGGCVPPSDWQCPRYVHRAWSERLVPRAAAHGWSADAPFVAMLRARLRVIGGDLRGRRRNLVRAAQDVGWAAACVERADTSPIYVEQSVARREHCECMLTTITPARCSI